MSYTIKQQKLKQIITDKYRNINSKYEMLKQAGYKDSTAKQPSRILKSQTFQSLRDEGEKQGLTDEFCIGRIKGAMKTRQWGNVLKALKLWWSIYYPESKANEIHNTLNISQTINNQDKDDYAIHRVKSLIRNGKIKIEQLQ